jgi:hypothetical protein
MKNKIITILALAGLIGNLWQIGKIIMLTSMITGPQLFAFVFHTLAVIGCIFVFEAYRIKQ